MENHKFAVTSLRKGWLILAGCMIIQAVPFCIASNLQPQFISYVIEGENFSLSSFSLIFTVGTLLSAAVIPFVAKIYYKINIKIVLLIGAVLSGGGFMSFSVATRLWEFYGISALVQIGTALLSSIGVPLLITSWFHKEIKGKILGLAFAGGSFGNIFFQKLTSVLLTNFGYKTSYLIFGIISLSVSAFIIFLLIRMPKNNSEIILPKNKAHSLEDSFVADSLDSRNDYTVQQCFSTSWFWVFAAGVFCIGLYVSALNIQYPSYLRNEAGFSGLAIGTIGSVLAFFALFGNIFGGMLFDKLGSVKVLVIALFLIAGSCISLIFVKDFPALAYVFAAFDGLAAFIATFGPAYFTGVLFGKKAFSSILGIVNLGYAFGFALGSAVLGRIIEGVGYTFTWTLVFIIVVLGYSCLIASGHALLKLQQR